MNALQRPLEQILKEKHRQYEEHCRNEISRMKERIRQLETFLLYFQRVGGSYEKDHVDRDAASFAESSCLCGRGGFEDAGVHAMPFGGQSLSRDAILRKLGEHTLAEQIYQTNVEGGSERRYDGNVGKMRSGQRPIGRVNYGDLSFPVLCGTESMACVEGGSIESFGSPGGDTANSTDSAWRDFRGDKGCVGLSTEAGKRKEAELQKRKGK